MPKNINDDNFLIQPKPENTDKESDPAPAKKSRVQIQARQYLDQTVVPILLQALSCLARERPADPITYLANYLLEHKSKYDTGEAPSSNP